MPESVEAAMRGKVELNVVAFQDCGAWVAQCVEYDIAARAPTLQALERAFERALAANVVVNKELGRSGLDGVPEAPPEVKALFEGSHWTMRPTRSAPFASVPNGVRIRGIRLAEAA